MDPVSGIVTLCAVVFVSLVCLALGIQTLSLIRQRMDQKHQLMMARELRKIAGDGTDLVKAIMLDKELAQQIAKGLQTELKRSSQQPAPKQLSVSDDLNPLPDPDQDTDLAHMPVQRTAQTT